MALLFAATALPSTAFAQDQLASPPVVMPVPMPAPQPVTPPRVTTQAAPTAPGESRTTIAPGVIEAAEAEARERAAARAAEARSARAATQSSQRAASRVQSPAQPAAPSAPAEASVAEPSEAAAVPQTAAPVTPPVAADPAPVEIPQAQQPVAPSTGGTGWLIIAALGGIAALIAGVMLLRRRRSGAVGEAADVPVAARSGAPIAPPAPIVPVDPVVAAPVFVATPPRRAPVAPPAQAAVSGAGSRPALEHPSVEPADPADVAAVLGGAAPSGDRPQLELALRPIRAGMSRRGAMLGFELTVANAGGLPADDVRIGAFMLGDGASASEIERLLIDPPADAVMDAEAIPPGEGAMLEASVTMPRAAVDAATGERDGFRPVLVADARYRLPDGREGRTAAAFRVGRVNGDARLEPIAVQDDPAMHDDIQAELVAVPAKV